MEDADTLSVICSFLQKRELVEVSNVSQLCRIATRSLISEQERRYFVNACVREDLVELVPPSQILALCFSEDERKLLVLVRVNSPSMGEEMECSLYVQEALPEGSRSDRRIDLPIEFALPTSHVHFEGNRFLCCTTPEEGLTIFDCVAEALLELPFSYDGFHASPNGRRCLIDYNKQLYYCSSDTNITLWREDSLVPSAKSYRGSNPRGRERANDHLQQQRRVPTTARFRARLTVENPLLAYPLGNSSSAWRAFWVGQSSVLYAHEQGVVLFKESTPPTGVRVGMTNTKSSEHLTPATEATPVAFERVELHELSELSCTLAHHSASTVSNTSGDADEYAIFNCRESTLHTVTVWTSSDTRKRNPTQEAKKDRGNVVVSQTNLQALIRPRSCIIKEVRVAVPTSTYMIFLHDHSEDRLLFFTADLTLTRWISIGEPSAMTLLVNDGIVISTTLPNAMLWDHPVIQAMEGGVGSVFSFSGEFAPDVLDPTITSITVASSLSVPGAKGKCSLRLLAWSAVSVQSFNGVEFLSWAALGVVSACLVWTISALAYNGWWLHLQLVFLGKVN